LAAPSAAAPGEPLNWNYRRRSGVPSLHRLVIMMLPAIGKNLVVSAYIQS
jgi:hypothetical protein